MMMKPIAVSWLVGVVVIELIFWAMNYIDPSTGMGATFGEEIRAFPISCAFTMAFLVPIYILFVIPLANFLCRFQLTGKLMYMVSGVLVGCLTVIFYSFLLSIDSSVTFLDHMTLNASDAKVVSGAVVGGGATGYIYWLNLPTSRVK